MLLQMMPGMGFIPMFLMLFTAAVVSASGALIFSGFDSTTDLAIRWSRYGLGIGTLLLVSMVICVGSDFILSAYLFPLFPITLAVLAWHTASLAKRLRNHLIASATSTFVHRSALRLTVLRSVSVLFAGCSIAAVFYHWFIYPTSVSSFSEVYPGMPAQSLERVVGPPNQKDVQSDGSERWYYTASADGISYIAVELDKEKQVVIWYQE
jgi:hypothetical protein